MELDVKQSGLNQQQAAYSERLFRWQSGEIGRIEKLVREVPARLIVSAGLQRPSLAPLANDLLNIRERTANFGRGQVTAELGRMK